ncbi:ATP-dependent nuclease [Pseudoalteromonas sp. JB197]|jgi:putative ATP-dependent endonuclease of OLD family|uniref:ATP-dependent nuclease n=1 Tax=Pseudoalteromonas sp. JB197 TaxID=1434839 RepID=UPI00097EEF85|nr:AAA family ATPase [Pseudoalteromonas sp. JB197]PCC12860.1 ATP-dependent endonuclease [Pseudoalteromonas sp. JB197]SJN40301.1 predicted ATP-dependent endonuclease, OLD family [Pseudoalteromonas sp. JB197]
MSQVPSIKKLKIKNFGCIGNQPIELDIDNIVVLVGPNNAGKSTILKAYEAVTDCLKLEQDDFHNKQVSVDNYPEIEVQSVATEDNKPGEEWCSNQADGTFLVREKWKWTGTNREPERVGFNFGLGRWAQDGDQEKMPWGMNNVAKARRPKPHRVNTFDDPEIQSKAITSLLKSLLEDSIQSIKENDDDEKTKYETLVESLKSLRDSSKITQQESIEGLEGSANEIISKIFPSHELKISAPTSSAPIKIDLLGNEFSIEMGPIGGLTFPLDKQGSGSRRTALWTILKLLADNGVRAKAAGPKAKAHHEPVGPNTAHVLLLDEPEVSLHPSATEIARDVLYSLPENDNWQIMVATHSPSFIDLTKDHTTIIRVDKTQDDNIETTTLFKPESAQLDDDDKENLKLINLFDSHISEAFFGGRVLIVEGDTEYSAFNYIKSKELEAGNNSYHDLNVIRARGKVTVASMMKVLNHFGKKFYALHDTDVPTVQSKRKNKDLSVDGAIVYDQFTMTNPAWTNNEKILAQMTEQSRVVASVINFEDAYFDETIGSDKPENCINHIKEEPDMYNKVKDLLDGILEIDENQLPEGALTWSDLSQLNDAVQARFASVTFNTNQ